METPDFASMSIDDLTEFIDELARPENAGPERSRPLREARAARAEKIRSERQAALVVADQTSHPVADPADPDPDPDDDEDDEAPTGTVPLFGGRG